MYRIIQGSKSNYPKCKGAWIIRNRVCMSGNTHGYWASGEGKGLPCSNYPRAGKGVSLFGEVICARVTHMVHTEFSIPHVSSFFLDNWIIG